MADEKETERLIRDLDSNNEYIRNTAAHELGKMAKKGIDVSSAVPGLIDVLKNEFKFSDVRRSAAEALVEIGEAAVPYLIDALKDKNERVRNIAADALKEMAENNVDLSSAVPALTESLKDKDSFVPANVLYRTTINLAEKGDFSSALKIIKILTIYVRKRYKGKKSRNNLNRKRNKLGILAYMTQEIHDKMNPDKKKFPVKHQQPVRTVRKKVIANG